MDNHNCGCTPEEVALGHAINCQFSLLAQQHERRRRELTGVKLFEYKVVDLNNNSYENSNWTEERCRAADLVCIQETINSCAAEGWRLIQVSGVNGRNAIFEREV